MTWRALRAHPRPPLRIALGGADLAAQRSCRRRCAPPAAARAHTAAPRPAAEPGLPPIRVPAGGAPARLDHHPRPRPAGPHRGLPALDRGAHGRPDLRGHRRRRPGARPRGRLGRPRGRARDPQRRRTSATCAASTSRRRRRAASSSCCSTTTPRSQHGLARGARRRAPSGDPTSAPSAPKLLYPDGRCRRRAAIVFCDGSGWNYGRGAIPSSPTTTTCARSTTARPPPARAHGRCGGELGGFDERYPPMYYEDTDLCFAGARRAATGRVRAGRARRPRRGRDGRHRHRARRPSASRRSTGRSSRRSGRTSSRSSSRRRPGSCAARATATAGRTCSSSTTACPSPDRDAGSLRMQAACSRRCSSSAAASRSCPTTSRAGSPTRARLQELGVEVLYGAARRPGRRSRRSAPQMRARDRQPPLRRRRAPRTCIRESRAAARDRLRHRRPALRARAAPRGAGRRARRREGRRRCASSSSRSCAAPTSTAVVSEEERDGARARRCRTRASSCCRTSTDRASRSRRPERPRRAALRRQLRAPAERRRRDLARARRSCRSCGASSAT